MLVFTSSRPPFIHGHEYPDGVWFNFPSCCSWSPPHGRFPPPSFRIRLPRGPAPRGPSRASLRRPRSCAHANEGMW